MAKKKTAESRKAQRDRKLLREAHLSPEMKASFKAINIWIAEMNYEKNKDKRDKRKMRAGCATVRANRRKLIILSERQNHRCCYCGGGTWHPLIEDYIHIIHRSESNKATLEHLLPNSQGGTYHWDNLAMACSECNTARGDLPIEEFLRSIRVVIKPKAPATAAEKRAVWKKAKDRRLKEEKSARNRFKLFMIASWMFPEDYQYLMDNLSQYDTTRVLKGGSKPTRTRKYLMKRIRRRVQENRMAA